MIKIENVEVVGWEPTIRGMRNPKNSWDKIDTYFGTNIDEAGFVSKQIDTANGVTTDWMTLGENDHDLMMRLAKGGPVHAKYRRMIVVYLDITAPLYWWKEFDTYKVGTVANSTSTMHKMASKPITLDCFEIDDYKGYELFLDEDDVDKSVDWEVKDIIEFCEKLRQKYLETKDKRYWKELVRWLPESWLQTRTVTMNYENVFNMVNQRGNHKLNEWSGNDDEALENFIAWAKSLPYANELIFNQTAEPFILFEKHNNL
jgi:hypothetical protein